MNTTYTNETAKSFVANWIGHALGHKALAKQVRDAVATNQSQWLATIASGLIAYDKKVNDQLIKEHGLKSLSELRKFATGKPEVTLSQEASKFRMALMRASDNTLTVVTDDKGKTKVAPPAKRKAKAGSNKSAALQDAFNGFKKDPSDNALKKLYAEMQKYQDAFKKSK